MIPKTAEVPDGLEIPGASMPVLPAKYQSGNYQNTQQLSLLLQKRKLRAGKGKARRKE